MRIEMKRVKEREATRQEEDAVLLEQQREACQAMEHLVRESDQEIQRMVDSAARKAEELESLRQEMESLNADKERLVRIHLEEVEELQGQLTRVMDTLSTKTTENEDAQTQEIQTLQTQIASMKVEKETLVKETMDGLKKLQCQLDQAMMCGKLKKGGKKNAKKLHLLQTKIDALGKEKESLVKLHSTEVEALEKSHARAIEELQENLKSRTPATATYGNEDKKESTTNEVQRRSEADEDTQDTDTSEAEERVGVMTIADVIHSPAAGNYEPLQDQNDMMTSMEKKQDELGIEHEKREAIVTSAYTLNRLSNAAHGDQTPYEVVWSEKPRLDHMRVFGSPGFVYVDKYKRAKFDTKVYRCIFLGYAECSKAYRVWDCKINRIVVTRTIALDERLP
ncbi:hypothetical protein PsorP6_001959 [Peronosclerospora sorghi]|uniref:Uncharacterized protein n=1 Tax=Peronosclerospora sorghi TaxID=230839 RepID=A0ACC0WPW8_9STRA|nr:hypothetical protein PsorP6_001959 [Peronosclerospora sorghi]